MLIHGSHRCSEMSAASAARLQRFFDENPAYFEAVHGEPARPQEAAEELASTPPAGMSYSRIWNLEFTDDAGEMTAMAGVISDLLAPAVWHIGLFIVANRLHGSGAAHEMYEQLQAWMRQSGARWIRLGVVAGNARAERFWERLGFVEVRRRLGVRMGRRTNDLRVMVKPLQGSNVNEYLGRVPRDRPETP
jgi:ribosomal protein S18 acetylase RimI-like enzyme